MTSAPNGLARITIDTPDRRLDLAAPADVPLAHLIRMLVRAGGERLAERGAATGWVVRRGGGATLSGAKSLQDQGVRDGDVLHLVPADETWPELEYDDITEAIAATRRDAVVWSPAAARRTSIAVGAVALLIALVAIVRDYPHGTVALIAGGFAAVLLGGGGIVARAVGDVRAGATVAALAIPSAAIAGLFARGGPDILVACLVAAVVAWVAAVAVGRTTAVFIALGLAAGVGVVGAVLDRLTTPVDAAAIVLGVVTLCAGLAPVVAVRLGGLGNWDADALAPAVARSDTLVVGLCGGVAVIVAVAATVLAVSGLDWPRLLALACLVALALRARVYGSLHQRLAALGAPIGVAVPLVASAIWTEYAPVALVAVLAATGAVLITGRPTINPRLAGLVEAVSLLAILPLLCGALNLYAKARALT